MDQLLTVKEAAATLAVTEAAIRKWLYQRRLRAVKVGRLTRLRLQDVQRVATEGLPELGTTSMPPPTAPTRLHKPVSRRTNGDGHLEGPQGVLEAPARNP